MKTFSIKEAFRRGWELLKANKKLLVASAFILIVMGAIQNVITNKHAFSLGLSMVILIIAFWVFMLILRIGYIKVYLKILDNEATSLRELVSYSGLFWKFLVACILYGLVMLGGFILLIIPGIYWAIKYQFVPILVVDEHVSAKEAFKISARMTQGVKWKLLWLVILIGLANLLGLILVVAGLLVSIPVTMLAYFHVYRKLGEKQDTPVQPA